MNENVLDLGLTEHLDQSRIEFRVDAPIVCEYAWYESRTVLDGRRGVHRFLLLLVVPVIERCRYVTFARRPLSCTPHRDHKCFVLVHRSLYWRQ